MMDKSGPNYLLAVAFPWMWKLRMPLVRDQWMLMLLAVNEIILGVDIYLAHSISGTIMPYEWIPIIFGPVAGVILLVLGLMALRKPNLAAVLATIIFVASIAVGGLGSFFHLRRALLLDAGLLEMVNLGVLFWSPPVLGPISFAGLGIVGLFAAWREDPLGSGVLHLPGHWKLRMPISKSSLYFFLVGLGILATVASSVMDHARTGFENPWLWLPTLIGTFATVVAVAMGFTESSERHELVIYLLGMGLMVAVGLLGAFFHVQNDLTASFGFVQERFLRGAPVLAPLNFANMALLGVIVLLNPQPDTENTVAEDTVK